MMVFECGLKRQPRALQKVVQRLFGRQLPRDRRGLQIHALSALYNICTCACSAKASNAPQATIGRNVERPHRILSRGPVQRRGLSSRLWPARFERVCITTGISWFPCLIRHRMFSRSSSCSPRSAVVVNVLPNLYRRRAKVDFPACSREIIGDYYGRTDDTGALRIMFPSRCVGVNRDDGRQRCKDSSSFGGPNTL